MLVLGRKVGEEVIISNEVAIEVLSLETNTVRLSIHSNRLFSISSSQVTWNNHLIELTIGDSVILNSNITISLPRINGRYAYLGFEAPKSVIINRKERNG